jgi:hypothetical protein
MQMSRVLWEEDQPGEKSKFCLLCPLHMIGSGFAPNPVDVSKDIQSPRQMNMKAYESDPAGMLESYKNGLILGIISFCLLAIPGAFVVYSMISASGYESRGTIVPPLSPMQVVRLKAYIGMSLGGMFLYFFCAIRCYLRLSKNPEKPCGFAQKAVLILSILLSFLGVQFSLFLSRM